MFWGSDTLLLVLLVFAVQKTGVLSFVLSQNVNVEPREELPDMNRQQEIDVAVFRQYRVCNVGCHIEIENGCFPFQNWKPVFRTRIIKRFTNTNCLTFKRKDLSVVLPNQDDFASRLMKRSKVGKQDRIMKRSECPSMSNTGTLTGAQDTYLFTLTW